MNKDSSESRVDPVISTPISAEQTKRLLNTDPAHAEALARKMLIRRADHPGALWLLGAALRRQGDSPGARAVLGPLSRPRPQMAAAGLELALALRNLGMHAEAADILRQTVDLAPNYADAWYALGDELEFNRSAEAATVRDPVRPNEDPRFLEAANALRLGRLDAAEILIKEFLAIAPEYPGAIKALADTAFLLGRYADAEALLARTLEFEPDFCPTRFQYVVALLAQQKGQNAVNHIDQLLQVDPSNDVYLHLKATTLSEIGEFSQALIIYERILNGSPDQPGTWLAYGRALRAIGRIDQCIVTFRKAIEILPTLIDAYWSLATVKTFCFDVR